MAERINMIGLKYGTLVVIEEVKKGSCKVVCEDCGSVTTRRARNLLHKNGCKECVIIKTNKKYIGKTFGYVTCLSRSEKQKGKFVFKCVCGVVFERKPTKAIRKNASCGCIVQGIYKKRCAEGFLRHDGRQSKTHGAAGRNHKTETTTYRRWKSMRDRCYRKTNFAYQNYGGKGAYVCDEWKDSYEAFLADLGECPSSDHTLDRIDNDKWYVKGNCRWALRYEQQANRKCTKKYQGIPCGILYRKKQPQVSYNTFVRRLDLGWSLRDACKPC